MIHQTLISYLGVLRSFNEMYIKFYFYPATIQVKKHIEDSLIEASQWGRLCKNWFDINHGYKREVTTKGF